MWIAEAALNAPLPPDWVEHTDDEGAVFYYNKDTGKVCICIHIKQTHIQHIQQRYWQGLYMYIHAWVCEW
jgi:hypothetical protein